MRERVAVPRVGEPLAGFSLDLTMTRMVLQVSGSQDFYPVHHDLEFARASGHPTILANTMFLRACLCRVITDWMGPAGFLSRLAFQMRRPNYLGDRITVGGRVATVSPAADQAELEVWIDNARHGRTVSGRATVLFRS